MSSPGYSMVTVASCEPSYVEEASAHIGAFISDLIAKAGCVGARFGMLATGEHAGHMLLIQSYEHMSGIEKAFGVYAESADYQAVISSGKVGVVLRNIVKLEDVGLSNTSSDMPKYGVVTRFSGPLNLDRVPDLLPIWEKGGAMILRYGTLITGSNAGDRLLIAGYPSMDAIEKTYDGLMASDTYKSIMADMKVNMRNIVRTIG